jgi:GH25 family lysozyme M1 (1,4-beta-N-acetylmuramidase)
VPLTRFRRFTHALVVATVVTGAPLVGVAGVASITAAHAATTIDGPDVSSYQHPNGVGINWAKVKAAGKDFAIIKATEGTYYTNPYFSTDYAHAHRAGLVRGSYHFARPGYPLRTTADAQADFFVSKLGSSLTTAATLPPALDLEVTGGLHRGALVTWAQLFLLRVRALTGRTPMIYTYPYFWSAALHDPAGLSRYPLWMASYDGAPPTPPTLWQFTSGARVEGIRGKVDMSRLTAPSTTWSTMSDGRVLDPWTPAAPGRPNHVYATPAAGSATVHWLPGDTGSSAVQHYWVTASPGGAVVRVSGLSTSATITGLTNGTAYTFTVKAGNDVGVGPSSASTTAVTPMIPTQLVTSIPSLRTFGQEVRVQAQLRRPDTGAVLVGQPVTLLVRPRGAKTWTSTMHLTTGDHGWVGRRLLPSTNIDVAFRYAGTTTTSSARSYSTAWLASRISTYLSRTRIHRGHTVTVHGEVGPTASGKTVTLQGYVAGRWSTLTRTTTSALGRYRFHVRPGTKSVRYYRTIVQSYGNRVRGVSRTVRLTVL